MCAQMVKSVTAPTDHALCSIAGAFVAIRMGNTAIRLQAPLPIDKIKIAGLEDVNKSLKTAQDHAKNWADNISQQVQNELQVIVDYNTLYASLAASINSGIAEIGKATPKNPPTNMANLAAELGALQSHIQTLLYGSGGSVEAPLPASALGTYNVLTTYQSNVTSDSTTFGKYFDIATSPKSGISADICNKLNDIKADNQALSTDRLVIAGGALAVIAGAIIIFLAIVLAPETGGVSLTAVVVGGIVAAGGAGAVIYGADDLSNKQADIVNKMQQITNDRIELAALTAIANGSASLQMATKNIYGALGTIKTTWQQMDNNLSSIISALNKPQDELMAWIKQHDPSKNPSYQVMEIILNAQFKAPQADWAKASKTAAKILDNFTRVVDFTPPPSKMPTQKEIEAQIKAA